MAGTNGAAEPPRYIQRPDGPRGRLPHRTPAPIREGVWNAGRPAVGNGAPGWRWRKPADDQKESEVTTGADVAQLVEQLTRNEQVVRSNRIVGSI